MRSAFTPLVAMSFLLPIQPARAQDTASIPLPPPATHGSMSVEEALATRRSVRAFRDDVLPLAHLGQLLWAAQGMTGTEGRRTAPSAGARYPLELYVAVGNVAGLAAGVYHYRPAEHALTPHLTGDLRGRLAQAAVRQDWIAQAAAVLVIASVDERTRARYRDRTERYVAIETGHVGQNVYLQAAALGLGTTMVGAFQDDAVSALLQLDRAERPMALMPVGRPR